MLATPSQTPSETSTPAAPSAAAASGPALGASVFAHGSETSPVSLAKITRGHSCVLCQQRKVKCDRQKPCANCVKARAECVVAAPILPRRRRRKPTETDLVSRLRRYEQLLKSHGISLDEDEDGQPEPATPKKIPEGIDPINVPRAAGAVKGALLLDKENSHYVENTLWEDLKDEMQDPQGSSEDDANETGFYPEPESILFGYNSASKDLAGLHPPVVHLFRLWQIFLDNVNPLIKIFHAPTVQQMILDASGNLNGISKPNEALMFSIYFLAIMSLTNQECEDTFDEPRQTLLTKYAQGAQQALVNARFLKSLNLTTLQALVQYLTGARRIYDPHSIWILTGTAVRIAQRLGVHRVTASTKLSPFETEMRRRTWWQVIFLDGHASKLAGAGFPSWLIGFDIPLPLNVSDSELNPAMKELPPPKDGATEMMFCCLRYEVVLSLRQDGSFQSLLGAARSSSDFDPDVAARKDRVIAELEQKFQQKYVRHCDPSIPFHLLVIYVAKSITCTMKIMSRHPRQYPDRGASMPQRERDMLFEESLTELGLDDIGHENKSIQRYLWHIHMFFQLDAFIYILSELRTRLSGEMVERAWRQVETSYSRRMEMITDTKNGLYVAIGNLTLKAWAKREEAMEVAQIPPPRYISLLRARRNSCNITQPSATPTSLQTPSFDNYAINQTFEVPAQNMGYDNAAASWANVGIPDMAFHDVPMLEVTPADWEYWQTLMDGDLPKYGLNPSGQEWY